MRFFSLAILAASALANAIPSPQAPTVAIVNFTAGCIPHSSYCDYRFGVTSQLGTVPVDVCFAHARLTVLEKLPPVVDQNDCKVGTTDIINPAWHWSIDCHTNDGLHFKVWYPFNSRSNLTFCHDIPANELKIDVHTTSRVEKYVGCSNFTMKFCHDQHS